MKALKNAWQPPDVFSPAEASREKKELIKERIGILPIDVDRHGYYYDPHEFFAALEKSEKKPIRKRNRDR